jgi:hypothetical protein
LPRFEFEFCNLALNLKTYFIWQNFMENIASPLLVGAKFAFPVSDANEDFDAPPPLAQSAYYCDIFLGARTTKQTKNRAFGQPRAELNGLERGAGGVCF